MRDSDPQRLESPPAPFSLSACFVDSHTSLISSSEDLDEGSKEPWSAVEEREIPEALLIGYRALIRNWCRNSLKGNLAARVDTSDVIQESLVQVWQDWSRLRGRTTGEIQSWMYRVARGHLAKLRRHHRAAKRTVSRQADQNCDTFGATPAPDDAYRAAERQLKLTIALESLPSELNEIVRLRLFAMLTFREIGEQLGVDREEARARFLRAIRKLRIDLNDLEPNS